MIQLLPAFREFLNLLNSNGVRYLIVGGYAVAFHGHPRATGDLDVWVPEDPTNLDRLRRALIEFGFEDSSIPRGVFKPDRRVLRIGVAPCRLEILAQISGVDFEQSFQRSIACVLDGVEVRIIGLDDLLINKGASGRLKDLADVAELDRARIRPGNARSVKKKRARRNKPRR